jgi:hypothetical protein
MNKKLHNQLTNFINSVSRYLDMEYHPKYYNTFNKDKNLVRIFDFVTGRYLGGNNVPDTAHDIVEFIDKHYSKDKNK